MKKAFIKTVSLALVITFIMSCMAFTVSADSFTYRANANGTGASSDYQSGKYYSNLTKITLTGDQRTDVLAMALSQLGYEEGNSSSQLEGTSGGSSNYTEFNLNTTGGNGYAWCASFCSWALYQSRVSDHNLEEDMYRSHTSNPAGYYWAEIYCPWWVDALKYNGYFKNSAYQGGSYIPQSGDLIFFYNSSLTTIAHVGMVVYSDGSYVYTVEGNTSDSAGVEDNGGGVYFKSYALNYSRICGYGALPYKTNDSILDVDYSGANPTPGLWITNAYKYLYADAACTTRAKYGDGVYCDIPRFTMFEATGVTADKKALIVNYDGVDGYVSINATDRVIQLTVTDDPEKMQAMSNLRELTNKVSSISYKNYTEETLVLLRDAYDQALAVLDNAASSAADYNNAYSKLDALYKTTGVNAVTDGVYINAVNQRVENGTCHIFTPEFGTVTTENAAITWTVNAVAKWDAELKAYVVISVTQGNGPNTEENPDNTPAITLASDEILIAAHNWEDAVPEDMFPVIGSSENANNLWNAQGGTQKLVIYGVDLTNGWVGAGAYLDAVSVETNTDESNNPTEPIQPIEPGEGENNENNENSENNENDGNNEENQDSEITPPADEKIILGDINNNGSVDMTDYILAKRAYFGTYMLTEDEFKRGNVNENEDMDMTDYILIKRVYFGTYSFE